MGERKAVLVRVHPNRKEKWESEVVESAEHMQNSMNDAVIYAMEQTYFSDDSDQETQRENVEVDIETDEITEKIDELVNKQDKLSKDMEQIKNRIISEIPVEELADEMWLALPEYERREDVPSIIQMQTQTNMDDMIDPPATIPKIADFFSVNEEKAEEAAEIIENQRKNIIEITEHGQKHYAELRYVDGDENDS